MIVCPMCKKPFKALTNTHMLQKHDLEMGEFKKKQRPQSLWSEESKRLLQGNAHAKGNRHTEQFKARWRKAVSKPRPKISRLQKKVWKERKKDEKIMLVIRQRARKVMLRELPKRKRGSNGHFIPKR